MLTLEKSNTSAISSYFQRVYSWMGFALLVTAVVAYASSGTEWLAGITGYHAMGLFILQLVLIFALQASAKSKVLGGIMLTIFSASFGVTLAVVCSLYTSYSVFMAAGIVGIMFVGLSLYGFVTKTDFRPLGTFLFLALLGLIAVMIANIFLAIPMLQNLISIAIVVLFSIFIVYDTQRMKDDALVEGTEILNAVQMYLNLINIFLAVLQLFGIKK